MSAITALLLALGALAADMLSTVYVLGKSKSLSEGNPLLGSGSLVRACAVNAALYGVMLLILNGCEEQTKVVAWLVIAVMHIGYAGWNLFQLWRVK